MMDIDGMRRRCLAMRSRMGARAVTRAYNARLRPVDLQVTEFALLAAVKRAGHASLRELAERLALERTTLTRNLQHLETRGLVEPAAQRRERTKRLRLTAAGEAVLERAAPLWAAAQDEIEDALGPARLAEVRRALEALAQAVRRVEAARGSTVAEAP
ncbi:MAG: winged helix-turn-helix transcriptional regulator [Alphaproteobacteria bacterium]|nr:winged helix-turn-helix transcriptional regulator [Alphaproteobacteria bacterium]